MPSWELLAYVLVTLWAIVWLDYPWCLIVLGTEVALLIVGI